MGLSHVNVGIQSPNLPLQQELVVTSNVVVLSANCVRDLGCDCAEYRYRTTLPSVVLGVAPGPWDSVCDLQVAVQRCASSGPRSGRVDLPFSFPPPSQLSCVYPPSLDL